MITDAEIEQKSAEFQISPIEVQKDYIYGWLLKAVFSRPLLARQSVLKGGNALRKGYLPGTRFSKDLDFSARSVVTKGTLERELTEVCALVTSQTGVRFVDRTLIRDKELGIPEIEALEARLYFKSFFGEQNLSLKTQLDITQFDRIYLPVQQRPLYHPYSDAEACGATIMCHKLEEILASKLTTLLHRRRAQDIFDLLYTIIFRNDVGVVRREVIGTFLRKSVFERNPREAREQLEQVPIGDYEPLWKSLIVPARSILNFSYVVSNFGSLLSSLFEAFVAPAAAESGSTGPRITRSGGRTASAPSLSRFFSAPSRATIISAGRSRTMIELRYDGVTRLVEPYKLEYYVRKSDGQGLEYFWGWDTSGGRSGKIGIKQFICDKIQDVRPTASAFQPRYVVEL